MSEVIAVIVIYVLLLIAGAVCFLLSALGVKVGARRVIDLTALGLFFWVLVPFLQMVQRL